jgi:hypothetical protein
MSLPQFDVQGSLFESLGAIVPRLFDDNDKYKLFAQKVWPVRLNGLLPDRLVFWKRSQDSSFSVMGISER